MGKSIDWLSEYSLWSEYSGSLKDFCMERDLGFATVKCMFSRFNRMADENYLREIDWKVRAWLSVKAGGGRLKEFCRLRGYSTTEFSTLVKICKLVTENRETFNAAAVRVKMKEDLKSQ